MTNQDKQKTLNQIETIVEEILTVFDIAKAPVPVEMMLQKPIDNMWDEIDLSEMSATFLSLDDLYAPRMSAVRLLSRNILRSDWGRSRNIDEWLNQSETVNQFARALIIPRRLLEDGAIPKTTDVISRHFEVPQKDVEARLEDLKVFDEAN